MENNVEIYKGLLSDTFARLMNFTLLEEFEERLGESIELFYNLKEGDSYEFDPENEFLFLTWFLLDDTDSDEKSLMNEFMKRNESELSPTEKQICLALIDTNLTLLEVREVKEGKSLKLKDLFLGEEFEVAEAAGADMKFKDNLLFTRVLRLGDERFLVGAGAFLPSVIKAQILAFISKEFQNECETSSPISFKQFLKRNGELLNWWIVAWQKGIEESKARE
ncbi:MAG: hypothetical protein HQM10_12665 [Candidatus Riflebacteria bacterium]|nr:hypothetical protein [Candidatus Riflebacteria bacterium]